MLSSLCLMLYNDLFFIHCSDICGLSQMYYVYTDLYVILKETWSVTFILLCCHPQILEQRHIFKKCSTS